MKSLRVSLVLATLFMLGAASASAQSSRMACKDGSSPKIGHFSCWGHGGLVTGSTRSAAAKAAAKPVAKAEAKPAAKKSTAASKAKKHPSKKSHATLTKAHKKTHPKRAAK